MLCPWPVLASLTGAEELVTADAAVELLGGAFSLPAEGPHRQAHYAAISAMTAEFKVAAACTANFAIAPREHTLTL